MNHFQLLAEPWWVNFFMLVPFVAYVSWRKGLNILWRTLLITAIFGVSFGFVEATVVVYLRAAVGLLPLAGPVALPVAKLSTSLYEQIQLLAAMPRSLLAIEYFREAATIVMLMSVAWLAVRGVAERFAIFLWCFAIWDIFYYIGLWVNIRWPENLLTQDLLFLIPVPWYSQVWFPLIISILLVLAVLAAKKRSKQSAS